MGAEKDPPGREQPQPGQGKVNTPFELGFPAEQEEASVWGFLNAQKIPFLGTGYCEDPETGELA